MIEPVKWEELLEFQKGLFREALEAREYSTCLSKVGCVLKSAYCDDTITSRANTHSYPSKSCEELGACPETAEGKCMNTVHAEIDCLNNLIGREYATSFDTAYITREPCYSCVNALHRASISPHNTTIYALDGKPNEDGRAAVNRCGVRLVVVTDWEGQA